MSSNGTLDLEALWELPGFDPYPARYNYLPASKTVGSNLVTRATYIDAINMGKAFRTAFGVELTFAEAYRSYSMQLQRRKEQNAQPGIAPNAADPGTSIHGWAMAIDFRNKVGTYGSPQHEWFVAHAKEFGFTPIPGEGWHWEHLSATALTSPSLDPADLTTEIIQETLMEKGKLFRNNSKQITVKGKKVANPNYGSVFLCSPLVGFAWHVPSTAYINLLLKLDLIDTKTPKDLTDGQWRFVTSQLPKVAK